MLIVPPTPFRGRRRIEAPSAPAPPVAMALVGASYDPDALTLLLTFNQSVNIAAFNGGAITVLDTDFTGWKYHGTGASLATPSSVLITLGSFQSSITDGVHLTATGATGIVASNGGGTWSGVTNLSLPFP
jgi:hypothetical protein